MVSDPLVLTIAGVAISLNKINQDKYESEWFFQDSLTSYRAKIRHSRMKMEDDGRQKERHNFQIVKTTFATATAPQDVDEQSFTLVKYPGNVSVSVGLAVGVLCAASSGAFLTQLLQWQN